jgi:omega-hydroxy-beta-dihydromenaquinone-9 sulfotransferase
MSLTVRKASLPMSRETLRWLTVGNRLEIPATTRMTLAWQAHWSRINWFLSRQVLAQRPVDPLKDPVFIIGPWRSGTTVMHELLAAATGLPTTKTWQCMQASSFLLTDGNSGKKGASSPRPMDGIPVHSDSPQEDEFALLALGVPSAYRAFLSPHRLSDLTFTLDQEYWLRETAWRETWTDFLRASLSSSRQSGSTLLLKSPNHTFRVKAILQRFPRSRFIWMDRNPIAIFQSNWKMWSSMFDLYNLTRQATTDLEHFLALALELASSALRWCIQNLPQEQFVLVQARELEASATETLRATCLRLDLAQSFKLEALQERLRMLPAQFGQDPSPTLSMAVRDVVEELRSACMVAHLSHGLNRKNQDRDLISIGQKST